MIQSWIRARAIGVQLPGGHSSIIAVGASSLFAVSALAGVVTSTWDGGTTGDWGLASNWSPDGVPQNSGRTTYDVVIDGDADQSSAVLLSGGFVIDDLLINAGDSLTIGNTSFLALAGGSFTNHGALLTASIGHTTDFRADTDLTITGSGEIVFSNTQANRIYGASSGTRITNSSSHLIRGSVAFGASQLSLTNEGEIRADSTGGISMNLTDGPVNFNTGMIRASSGGSLTITSTTLDNTAGEIEAAAGSIVDLTGAHIKGGTLRDADGPGAGAVRNVGAITLEDVTLQGTFSALNTSATLLRGTIDIQDTLSIESIGHTTDLLIETSPFTLGGSGQTSFSNTQANRLYGVNGSVILTIPSSHLVRGSLQFGAGQLMLANDGEIRADLPAGMVLNLTDGPGNANTGMMRASDGSTLLLQATTLDNTSGVIEAAAGSNVDLTGVHIIGGVLRDADGAGAGAVRNTGGITLESVTLEGPFHALNTSLTILRSGIDIEDALSVESIGHTTDVRIDTSPLTLGGGGEIVFSNTLANRLYGISGDTTLIVPSDFVVRGAAQLGIGQLKLANDGEIRADAATETLLIDLTDGAGNSNTGTLRATGGARLQLQSLTLENAGGLIEAGAASTVDLTTVHIKGGTIRDIDGAGPAGSERGGITLEDVTIEGPFHAANTSLTILRGAIDIQGSLTINSIGHTTDLRVDTTPFSLAGPGDTVFSNTQANRFYGVNGSVLVEIAKEHTLRGSFQFGVNQTQIVNNGTIDADASGGISIDPTDGPGFANNGLLRASHGDINLFSGPFNNTGVVEISAGRLITCHSVSYGQSDGDTRVDGTLSAASGVSLSGGTLSGSGVIAGPVNNTGGSVEPGDSPGILSMTSSYFQDSGGALAVEIGGTTVGSGYDRLGISGGTTIGGALRVTRINGFTPHSTDMFTILTSTGALIGTFSAVQSCDAVQVIYGPNSVSVRFPNATGIVGDLNFDGLVNGADITIILGDWGPCEVACCPGDATGDGLVNGADITVVLGNWAP